MRRAKDCGKHPGGRHFYKLEIGLLRKRGMLNHLSVLQFKALRKTYSRKTETSAAHVVI